MKIGLYENYKFTNLSEGGGSNSTPPGHTETNKLRGSIKELKGVQPPHLRQFATWYTLETISRVSIVYTSSLQYFAPV